MRSEILGEKEHMEESQKDTKRKGRGPASNANSPKYTDGVLQMDSTCCYLNDGPVAETLPTSLRLHPRQMGRLED